MGQKEQYMISRYFSNLETVYALFSSCLSPEFTRKYINTIMLSSPRRYQGESWALQNQPKGNHEYILGAKVRRSANFTYDI